MLSSTFKPGMSAGTVGPDGQHLMVDMAPGWELKVEGQLLDKVSDHGITDFTLMWSSLAFDLLCLNIT